MTKLQEIAEIYGEENLLCQLAEECAELAQAALKLRRAMNGTTPITESAALDNLAEEIADVDLCLDALYQAGVKVDTMTLKKYEEKKDRWHKRVLEYKQRKEGCL